MAKVNSKDLPDKQQQLGQFFTPPSVVEFCLSKTNVTTPIVIEPSSGAGAFLPGIRERWPHVEVIAVEADAEAASRYDGHERLAQINFYDMDVLTGEDITFIGNPPFRTPAPSLGKDQTWNRKDIVRNMCDHYGVVGVREEAVFFVIKCVDLILSNGSNGHLYFILPKTMFRNNSKAFQSFAGFLRTRTRLVSVDDIGKEFEGVTTDLCYVHLAIDGTTSDQFLWNGSPAPVDSFYGVNVDIIPFQQIFKKTYLGSVPCESVLLSCRNEPVDGFRQRLVKLMQAKNEDVFDLLCYQGEPHLRALQKRDKAKIAVVTRYVEEMRELVKDWGDPENYKQIRHRNEDRFYFRHDALKRATFLYQINPNPCPSFYFPGNPVKGCLDYCGETMYDVNRNCSPSANRTVPLANVEDNLTDDVKLYWNLNTDRDFDSVFSYLKHVLNSDWYKQMKREYQRWYFGIPRKFMEDYASATAL